MFSTVRLYRDAMVLALSRDTQTHAFPAETAEHFTASVWQADVAVVDAGVSHSDDLVQKLKRGNPAIKIVVVAVESDDRALVKFAEAGVDGIVASNGSAEDLVRVVREAILGNFVGFAQLTHALFDRVSSIAHVSELRSPGELTPREHEIAQLLSEGLSNKEIAAKLRIGDLTVKNHVHHILEKLGLRRRSQVAALARQMPVDRNVLEPC